MENNVLGVGTPTLSFLPARNYYFKVLKERHKVVLPNSGGYKDIVESESLPFFEDGDNHFLIYDSKASVVNFSDITKLMFATKQYPDLSNNTLFVPQNMYLSEDNIIIIGHLVVMLSEDEYNKEIEKIVETEEGQDD